MISLIGKGSNMFTVNVDPEMLELLKEYMKLRAKELGTTRSKVFTAEFLDSQKERLKDELKRLRNPA